MTVLEDKETLLTAAEALRSQTFELRTNICFLIAELERNIATEEFARWPERTTRAEAAAGALWAIRRKLQGINNSLIPLIDRHISREHAALAGARVYDLAAARAARENGRKRCRNID